MYPRMSREFIRPREALIASRKSTRMRFLASVRSNMTSLDTRVSEDVYADRVLEERRLT
jgi:hypothetical protein